MGAPHANLYEMGPTFFKRTLHDGRARTEILLCAASENSQNARIRSTISMG